MRPERPRRQGQASGDDMEWLSFLRRPPKFILQQSLNVRPVALAGGGSGSQVDLQLVIMVVDFGSLGTAPEFFGQTAAKPMADAESELEAGARLAREPIPSGDFACADCFR